MSEILHKIISKLDLAGVAYESFEHVPVITSEDAARVRDTDMSMGAKALIFLADGEPIVVVVPGDKKLDLGKFKKLFDVKDLAMADDEKLKNITGLSKGAVPPMGSVFGIRTFFSEDFLHKDMVAFNAGSHTNSVCMKAEDLVKVENPTFGDFSK